MSKPESYRKDSYHMNGSLANKTNKDKHTQKYTRLVRLEAGTVVSLQREDNLGKYKDTKDVAYLTSK